MQVLEALGRAGKILSDKILSIKFYDGISYKILSAMELSMKFYQIIAETHEFSWDGITFGTKQML